MKFLRHTTGQIVHVNTGAPLSIGGEGRIYVVSPSPSLIAKIYDYNRLTEDRIRKLIVMLESPPETGSIAVTGHIPIAWPVDILRTTDAGHRAIGFLMPRVNGMYPVADFYNPRSRRRRFPLFNTRYLHRAANNLAASVHALHTSGYVIGDVNESNIFVSNTAQVTIVDTDSFQVCDSRTGVLYRCGVGRPEFTPPELQGANFSQVDRAPIHDLFGLGVLIFQLLMEGIHPFEGVFNGSGDPPSYQERIAAGHFPYGGDDHIPYRPKPSAPPLSMLHPELQALFIRCFEQSRDNPQARPDARSWQTALEQAEYALVECGMNAQHRYSGHLDHCPWCERTVQLDQRDPFPSREALEEGTPRQRVDPAPSPLPDMRPRPPLKTGVPVSPVSSAFPARMTPHQALGRMVAAALLLALTLQAGLHPAIWIGLMAAGCSIIGWQHARTGQRTSLTWAALGLCGAMLILFLIGQ